MPDPTQRPYWFERLGMKGGEDYNVALRLLTEKLEAIELKVESLMNATTHTQGMMDK